MVDQELRFYFMGGIRIMLGDEDITLQLSTKSQALLCYLALTGQVYSRQVIAGLFWGEKPEEDARRSLRVNLTQMRQLLDPYLIITRHALAFNRQSSYWLDVEAFEHYIERGRRADGTADITLLREAAALYQGGFLHGFDARDARPFEEWMQAQYARLHQMALNALDILVEDCIVQEAYDLGIEYANQLLALDNWRETAHRQLMWLLARSGQRNAALAQYDTCKQILAKELQVEPMAETTTLYHEIRQMQWVQRETARPLPPLPQKIAVEATPFQAPPPVSYFLGREAELTYVRQLLAGPSATNVYAVTGMGGVGKTSLAIHLAHALRDDFPDGVLWAHAATDEPMAIAENWAAAYGYDFSSLPDLDSRARAVRTLLTEKRVLVVLDDVTSAARIRPLLPTTGSCTILLTTRNLDLATALGAHPLPLKELSPTDGRQLLTRIIGAQRVEQDETATVAIGRLLHNLPLALTIAARYLASRPRRRLADFAAQLQHEANRLDLKLEDRAVRASFAISWQALDDTQRRIFSLLAVFAGRAFTADALAAIAAMDRFTAQDRLDALVTLSLLSEEGERHYRQHPLLADFAGEHLGVNENEELAAYRRMVDYFLTYAIEYQRDYHALQPEWENLSAAIQTAHRLRLWSTVIEYTRVLCEAWFARGRFSAARQAYTWAHEAAMALEDETAFADNLLYWGRACMEQSDFDEAQHRLRESLAFYEELENQAGIASAHCDLARIALDRGDYKEAENSLAISHRLREQLGDRAGVAETIYRQSRLAHSQGRYEESKQLGQQALTIQAEIPDKPGMVRTLRHLVFTVAELGEYELAAGYAQRSLSLAEELHDQGEKAMALYGIAWVSMLQGNLDVALQQAEQSLDLLKRMGDRRSQALVLYTMSLVRKRSQEYEAALEVGQRSLLLFQDFQDTLYVAFTLTHIGDFLYRLEKPDKARIRWSEAHEIAQNLNHNQLITHLRERLQEW